MIGDKMSVKVEKITRAVLDTGIVQIRYDSKVSDEIQFEIWLTGNENNKTICNFQSIADLHSALTDLVNEL